MARKHGRLLIQAAVIAGVLAGIVFLVPIAAQPIVQPTFDAAVADDVRQLWQEAGDHAAARELAQDALNSGQLTEQAAQHVEYEYAVTYFVEGRLSDAVTEFSGLVTRYAGRGYDGAAANEKVDDAQFFVAELNRRLDDEPAAIAAYQQLVDNYPNSNRFARAAVWLASFRRAQDRYADSFTLLEEVVANHYDDPAAPEAQIHIGRSYVEQGQLRRGATELLKVADLWPTDQRAPEALYHAAKAYMEEEEADWRWIDGMRRTGQIQNAPDMEAVLNRLVSDYPDSPQTPEAMLGIANYHARQTWWNPPAAEQAVERIRTIGNQMIAMYPEARETRAVRGYLVRLRWNTDKEGALAEMQDLVLDAGNAGDMEHYLGGHYLLLDFMRGFGQYAEVRTIVQDLQQYEMDPMFAGELALLAAQTYGDERNYEACLKALLAVADNAAFPDDVRSAALGNSVTTCIKLGQSSQALSLADELIAKYPGTHSAEQVRRQLPDYRRRIGLD
jgi:tetratricopeptide (TPR) repeat protein